MSGNCCYEAQRFDASGKIAQVREQFLFSIENREKIERKLGWKNYIIKR